MIYIAYYRQACTRCCYLDTQKNVYYEICADYYNLICVSTQISIQLRRFKHYIHICSNIGQIRIQGETYNSNITTIIQLVVKLHGAK